MPSSSPAWSLRLASELQAADQDARELVTGLTEEQLNWQPVAGAWSIGQCLEHLSIANEVYLPVITAALVDKPTFAVEEISLGWFARWFIRSFVDPSPVTKHAPAPKKIVPGSHVGLSILDRFLRGNQDTRDLICHAAAYDVNRIRFVNPFIPLLRFTVGTGFRITCGHERRHLLQARRVKESAGFPR